MMRHIGDGRRHHRKRRIDARGEENISKKEEEFSPFGKKRGKCLPPAVKRNAQGGERGS